MYQRPSSSCVKATGFLSSGSEAKRSTFMPGSTWKDLIALTASLAGSPTMTPSPCAISSAAGAAGVAMESSKNAAVVVKDGLDGMKRVGKSESHEDGAGLGQFKWW